MEWYGLTIEDQEVLMLSVGEHHLNPRPKSPTEVGRLFQVALNNGASRSECAKKVHLEGTSMVSRFTSLLKLDPAIRHFVDWGTTNDVNLGFSAASELGRIAKSSQQECFKAIIENRFKKTEVQQLNQFLQRTKKSLKECIQEVIQFRPTIITQVVFIGKITHPNTMRRLRGLQQSDRDELLQVVLRTLEIQDTRGRLAPESFSLVGDKTLQNILTSMDNVEVSVNTTIQESLIAIE